MTKHLLLASALCLLAHEAGAQSQPLTTHQLCLVQRGAFTAGIFVDYANGSYIGHAPAVPAGQDRCFSLSTWTHFSRAAVVRVTWSDGLRFRPLCEFRLEPPFRNTRIVTTGTTLRQHCALE